MWLILLLFYPVNSIPYPKERCTTTDCSWQLHPFQNGSCVIHNTSVCKYSMTNFTQSSEVELRDEERAKFSISITPYMAEIYGDLTFTLSAINITLVVHGMGVNALAVKITKQNSTICRILDFQNLESNFTLPVNFFYDCFYDLRDYQNVQMDVIALPMNNLLSYYVYIPPSQPSNPIGLDTLTVICLCIVVLFTCCSFVFYKFGDKSTQLELSKKRGLLVFSHDCQEHKEFVSTLIDYFSRECCLEVSSIYNRQGPLSNGQSAEKWREDRYDESDVIIFLISEGLLITLNEENKDLPPLKVFHPWKTQLQDASEYILGNFPRDSKIKKICKVLFSYSRKLRIPKHLDRKTGKCFLLPQQMNKFLNFVHDCHSAIPCLHQSLCESLDSSKVGKNLLHRIEAVQAKVNNNVHVEYEPDGILNKDMQEMNSHLSLNTDQNSKEFFDISLCESSNFSETSAEASANEDNSLLNDDISVEVDKCISDSDEFCNISFCESSNVTEPSAESSANEDDSLLNDNVSVEVHKCI